MALHISSERIVSLLREHEQAIAALYRAFGKTTSGHSRFWEEIAKEEDAHADVLKGLEELLREGKVTWNPSVWHMKDLNASLEFISAKHAEASRGRISPEQAFRAALYIEGLLVENSFFTAFDTAKPEVKREFDALREHTAAHIQRLQKEFAKL